MSILTPRSENLRKACEVEGVRREEWAQIDAVGVSRMPFIWRHLRLHNSCRKSFFPRSLDEEDGNHQIHTGHVTLPEVGREVAAFIWLSPGFATTPGWKGGKKWNIPQILYRKD